MDYINEFRNKSEEERALDTGKPLPGFHTSRFFVRNYLSFIFGLYALFVSETILEFCAIVGMAIIIDLLRKKYVPELSEFCGELWERFERENQKPGFHPTIGLRNRPHAIFLVTVWGYYILVIVIHNMYGPEAMNGYFTFFEFIPEFASHFSRMQENLTEGLINVGYPHMVPLTNHVYSVAHVGTILWIISLTCFGNMKITASGFNLDIIKNRSLSREQQKKKLFVCIGFACFGAFVSQLIVDDIGCTNAYLNICNSQFNYFGYIFALMTGFLLFIALGYQGLMHSLLLTSPSSYGSRQLKNKDN